ncbi:MAG: DUF1127 domain-containing protein [Rhodospirillales bacterium]|nr:DUF1127 domain-containing protein [Rhodospirillales bacterium]
MNTAHNENQETFSFVDQAFPRHVNTQEILIQANQIRSEEIARLGKAFGKFISRTVIAPMVIAFERRRMYEELSQLSDRVLDDIGLTRGSIAQAVADAFPRETAQPAKTAKATLHSLVANQGAQVASTVSNDHSHHPLAA